MRPSDVGEGPWWGRWARAAGESERQSARRRAAALEQLPREAAPDETVCLHRVEGKDGRFQPFTNFIYLFIYIFKERGREGEKLTGDGT